MGLVGMCTCGSDVILGGNSIFQSTGNKRSVKESANRQLDGDDCP